MSPPSICRLNSGPRPKSNFQGTSHRITTPATPTVLDSKPQTLPTLPVEVWTKIISFTVRLAGAHAVEFDDPFLLPHENEEYPGIEDGLFEDRKSLMLVCSRWRSQVREICCQYLTIHTAKELKFLVELFENSRRPHNGVGKPLGDWTLRIDFKILGPYNESHIVRLLKCTPNLLIYNNKNGHPDLPEKPTPRQVLEALVTHCAPSLQRLEWSGAGEPPRFQDLAELCNSLPCLTTLRLVAIYSFPLQASDGIPPVMVLPKLKILSLGIIPRLIEPRPEFPLTWDPFLQYLSLRPQQLPSLERFECDIFPLAALHFFHVHGRKLRLFRTPSTSVNNAVPTALQMCPDLETLVFVQGSGSVDLPVFHGALRRICIVPAVDVAVEVPDRILHYAVVNPLDGLMKSIEAMVTPLLSEVRIWNVGAYSGISTYVVWLSFWWRRWNIRGVRFCDKAGQPYRIVHNSNEALLDLVRG